MDYLLTFSQSTGIFAFMNSPWGWPIAESLHFIGLSLLLGTVGVFDLRLLGMAPGVSLAALHKLVPWGVLGYSINVTTGIMFLTTAPDQYIYNPAFITKMLIMSGAGINMVVFYTTTSSAVKGTRPVAHALSRGKIIAAVSLSCWLGVIVCGRLITYYRPPYHWCLWC